MLVLTRRIGEEIIIGDNIRVKIVSIKGDRIRVGIDAPDHVSVDRAEVHARRAEFQGEQDIVPTIVKARALNDHLDSIQIGEMPVMVDPSTETLKH